MRAGRFADVEDAIRNRQVEAADQAATRHQEGRQGCRIDAHLPPHEHTVKIKIKGKGKIRGKGKGTGKGKTRQTHPDGHAPTPPAQTPPPF